MNVLRYAARYARAAVLVAVVAGIAGGALSASSVAVVGDTLRTGTSTGTHILAFAAMTIAGAVLRFLSSDILTRLSQRHMLKMTQDLGRRVVAAGLRDVEELGSSRLMATLTEDLAIITNTIAITPVMITHLAIFVACFLYVAWLSWQVWAIGTACIVVGVASYSLILRRANAYQMRARDERDALMGHFRALTDGFTELKLHRPRRTAFLARTFDASLESIARLNTSALTLFNAGANYHQLMFFLFVAVLVFGAMRWTSATSATVTSAILALLYARGPLETIVNWAPSAARADVALAKYESVIAQLPGEHTVPEDAPAIDPCERIDLVGVEYQYSGDDRDRFGLGPIDLTIRAGEILFVTGGNGSGKSTLAKIVAGLYLPMGGELRVDGVAVTDGNRDQYRQLVSSIFASFHLFPGLLGLERPTIDDEARSWLGRMRLAERVQVHDGVFSDLRLSTGQRKRLALVVAMLEDRPLYIFDEWAADQDPQYREEFYSSLLPELKRRHKMVIVISHDDRYYALGDRVVKLERGQIVAGQAAREGVGAGAAIPSLVAL